MGTTADKLNKVLETKEAIRTAINNKGGTLTETDKFSDYATAIDNIQSGGGDNLVQYVIDNYGGDGKPSCYYLFYKYLGSSLDDVINNIDTSNATNMNYMFYECHNLTSIPPLDTSKVTSMSGMFASCYKITSIPPLDTSNVSKMDSMFSFCSTLTSIPPLDTSNATDMISMFYECHNLTSIPPLDTSKVTKIREMFFNCYMLTTIDLTYMNITSNYYGLDFAYNCYSLTKLIVRNMNTIPILSSSSFTNCYHFYGTTNATYNPDGLKDGRIYVPDDKVEALKTATNWSVFADIIVPLSTLVEE